LIRKKINYPKTHNKCQEEKNNGNEHAFPVYSRSKEKQENQERITPVNSHRKRCLINYNQVFQILIWVN
jgi:hypothetical protein